MAQTEEDFEEKDETVTQPVLHTQDKWIKFEQPKDDRVCVDPLPEPPLLSKDLSSAEYLSKLESRLAKLKGKSSEMTSKDLIKALEQARIDHTERLVKSSDGYQAFIVNDDHSTTQCCCPIQSARKYVNPRQPLSSEEVECLVEAEQWQNNFSG